jgi:hypothetical protein
MAEPMIARWRYAAIAVLALWAAALVSHADASIFGRYACASDPSKPDFNRNGICERILDESSITTPILSTGPANTEVYRSSTIHVCPPGAVKCTFSNDSASGTISFTISGNAGATEVISATVGFSAVQSFTWSAQRGGLVVNVRPGTSWFFWIRATGTHFTGNYNAEFWELNDGWRSVGHHSFGNWSATNYTNTEKGWSSIEAVPGMENVFSTNPQTNLINAHRNTPVTVHYRKPIATPDAELANAITVRDGTGKVIPGTLAIAPDRTFLRFCAAEPYATARPAGRFEWEGPLPEGMFFVDFQSVEFKDGDKAKAFSIEFWVEFAEPAEDALSIYMGARPCDRHPIPADYTLLRTP